MGMLCMHVYESGGATGKRKGTIQSGKWEQERATRDI